MIKTSTFQNFFYHLIISNAYIVPNFHKKYNDLKAINETKRLVTGKSELAKRFLL